MNWFKAGLIFCVASLIGYAITNPESNRVLYIIGALILELNMVFWIVFGAAVWYTYWKHDCRQL